MKKKNQKKLKIILYLKNIKKILIILCHYINYLMKKQKIKFSIKKNY